MAFPKNPINGQLYDSGGYTYRYSSTKFTWTKIGQTSSNIGNVSVSGGNVSTGNTSITSNAITTGNTSITSNTITTGNTSITSNSITTGNTVVSDTGIVAGNTSISNNSISTGNTSITSNGITTGNTTITSNTISTGNTTLTETGLTTGNTTITSNTIATGNTSITDTGLTTGNTSITNTGLTTGNTSITSTAITTGNTSITSNSITTGNTVISSNTISTGNTSITNAGLTTGNTTITSNAIATGNTSITNAGLTTGNTTITSNAISTGNTNITSNGITTGNTTITSNTVTVGNTSVTETAIITETITANNISGNGSSLTNITASNIVGAVANANYAAYAGNITISNQPNITGVGTLGSLTVAGNATIAGDLTVTGNTSYINVTTVSIKDPVIQLGGGPNGAPLTTNDGKDRGTVLHYYNDQPVSAFMGWDTSNAEFLFASNVQLSSDIVAVNQLANIRADYIYGNFVGNISGNIILPGGNTELIFSSADNTPAASPNLRFNTDTNTFTVDGTANIGNITTTGVINSSGNITAPRFIGNLQGNATSAQTVTTGNQPNITSVGTLIALAVTGNISAGNVNGGNLISASYLSGELLTSSQPNITSIGTLNSLSVSGNITGGNGTFTNTITASDFVGNGGQLSYLNGSNVSEVPYANFATYAGTANTAEQTDVANTVRENAQPNITSVGTLSSLAVAGMLTSFNAVLGNTVSANFIAGDGYQLSNIQAANLVGDIPNANFSFYSNLANFANVAETVSVNAQPNITSVGTLSSLAVIGNVTAANAVLGNLVAANYFVGDGGLLSNISTGEFANYANYAGNAVIAESSLIAGTVTEAAQPNITSIGVLDELTVTGNIYAGNIDGGNLVTALYLSGDGSFIANITGSTVTGWVPQANYSNFSGNSVRANSAFIADSSNTSVTAVTVTGSSQPNITSIGQLSSLSISGNIIANNATFGNAVFGLYFVGDGGNLGNLTGSNIVGLVENANVSEYANIANSSITSQVANTVADNAQPNITSVGVLDSLTVTGNTILANITATGVVSGNVLITTSDITADEFIGNFTGNFAGPGYNSTIIFNDSGSLTGSNALQFSPLSNTVTLSGSLDVVDSITRDGKEVPTYTTSGTIPINPLPGDEWYDELNDRIYKYIFDGLTYAWIDITSGFISANISSSANTMVLRDANGNIYGNLLSGTSLYVSTDSNLGDLGNITITGGSSGYLLSTDGTGNLTWVDASAQGVAGSNTEIQFNNNGSFGADSNLTFNTLTDTLAVPFSNTTLDSASFDQSNVTILGNLVSLDVAGNAYVHSGYLHVGNGIIVVDGANAGIFNAQVLDLNIGLGANVNIGNTLGNTTIKGNLVANANLYVADTATITNLKVNDFYSNRTPIVVTINTIVDSFPVNKYRSAKYTMRINSDDGYQAVEALLVHDGANSYVTIYGSLSTIGTDIITLSTTITSGNVQLLATSGSINTTVNLLGTYVAD
jgi:hypothetical protein